MKPVQAQQLADLAEQNPREWQMHPDAVVNGFDGIIFDNGTFTVGSNGDYETFASKERAINALEWSWRQQSELHAE